jgi:hypothetical protein
MLCLMHEAEPYGFLHVNGNALSDNQLASQAGIQLNDVVEFLKELETQGVFSRSSTNSIYSRRMIRDFEKREQDKTNGNLGGNPRLKGPVNPQDKTAVNPRDKTAVKAQKLEVIAQTSDLKKEDAPLASLAEGGRLETRSGLASKIGPQRSGCNSKVAEAKPGRRIGTLPSDWKPPDRAYPLADQFGQSVGDVEAIFRDYLASSGKLYADHDAAFCNFIRNEKNFTRGVPYGVRKNDGRGSIVAAADRAIAHLEREIAADRQAGAGVINSLPPE